MCSSKSFTMNTICTSERYYVYYLQYYLYIFVSFIRNTFHRTPDVPMSWLNTQWLMKSSLSTSKLRLSTLKLRLSQSSSQDSVKNMLDNVAIRHTRPGQLECCLCLSVVHWHHPPLHMLASSGANIIQLHSNFNTFLQDQVSNPFQVQARQNPTHHHNRSLSTNFFSRYHFVFASWLYLLHCSYHVYCPACPK